MGLNGRTDYLVGFSPELGFTPNGKEVIFLSPQIQSPIDDFFRSHYAQVAQLFAEKGYQFVYIPEVIRSLAPERITYNYPGTGIKKSRAATTEQIAELIYRPIFDKALTPLVREPMLIRYKNLLTASQNSLSGSPWGTKVGLIFSHKAVPVTDSDDELMAFFRDYASAIGGERIFFSLAKPKTPQDTADFYFNERVTILQEEIKERVEQLRQLGVTEMVLRSLLDCEPSKPSRLHITKDYKVFLTDYYDREIKIEVLPKVLFFFYLNHPEGVRFKQLSDYTAELIGYYKELSNRVDLAKLDQSIRNPTDPTKNTINEKCSLLRSSFVKEFDEAVVRPYIITTGADLCKHITLPRDLVVDDSGIIPILKL